jgi:hypothetical protein
LARPAETEAGTKICEQEKQAAAAESRASDEKRTGSNRHKHENEIEQNSPNQGHITFI